jgi:flavin-dependent dehydrogenase
MALPPQVDPPSDAPYYDVIIVGGGPGGLSCAKHLKGSGLKVLVLEKSSDFGKKICSGEITRKVLPGQDPSKAFKGAQEWKTVTVGTAKKATAITYDKPFLWTVGRYEFESWLRGSCDADIRMLETVTSISPGHVQTTKGRYRYKHLVGADGSFSFVRQHLGLPKEHVAGWAFHYVVDSPAHEFRVCWLPKIFPNGYGYVMSKNKGSTMIGGAMTGKGVGLKELAPRVKSWVEEEFLIDTTTLKSEGFRGNADYRGWRFKGKGGTDSAGKKGDIYLVGDAAGLLNPVTTEGIYYAITSGEGVAKTILGDKEGGRIMARMARTHMAQVLLFDLFNNQLLPFCYIADWIFTDPSKGLKRKVFDKIFWMFMDK